MADEINVIYKQDISQIVESTAKMQKSYVETEVVGKKAFSNIGTSSEKAAKDIDKVTQAAAKAKTGFNGLNSSINQISRELPNFAMNAQIGFLAISNNLPILADAINNVRQQNALLAAEGKATIPIWKQVASSIFGWQTALTIGITLLTLYGSKMVSFIGELLKGNATLSETRLKFEALNKAYDSESLPKAVAGYLKMQENVKAAKNGLIDKESVLKEYNQTIGRTVGFANNLNEADALLVSNKNSYVKAVAERTAAMQVLEEAAALMVEKADLERKAVDQAKTSSDIEFQILRKRYGEQGAIEGALLKKRDELNKLQTEIDKKLRVADQLYQPNVEQAAPGTGKKVEDALVSQFKRQRALLEAQGKDTFNISKMILSRELSLLESGSKEYLDKENEIRVLIAKRDKEAADLREKQREEENKARIASEQMVLEAESKIAAAKLDAIRKRNKDEIDLAEDKIKELRKVEKDSLNAESRNNRTSFKRRSEILERELNQEYITRAQYAELTKQLETDKLNAIIGTFQGVASILGSLSSLLGAQTEAGKVLAIAETTIDTYVAAQKAYKAGFDIDPSGTLSTVNAIAAVVAGLARVQQIQSVQVPQPGTSNQTIQQVQPRYATGVVDLAGPGSNTSDSIHARISRGESVITAKATKANKDELIAMNYGGLNYRRLIEDKYIRPAIEAERKRLQSEVFAISSPGMSDKGIIKAIRSNKPASAKDIKSIADAVDRSSRESRFLNRNTLSR